MSWENGQENPRASPGTTHYQTQKSPAFVLHEQLDNAINCPRCPSVKKVNPNNFYIELFYMKQNMTNNVQIKPSKHSRKHRASATQSKFMIKFVSNENQTNTATQRSHRAALIIYLVKGIKRAHTSKNVQSTQRDSKSENTVNNKIFYGTVSTCVFVKAFYSRYYLIAFFMQKN